MEFCYRSSTTSTGNLRSLHSFILILINKMVLIRVAAVLALAQLGLAATTTTSTTSSTTAVPTCGYKGWDKSAGNIGYYADDTSTTYSTYSQCSALCTANSDCASFAYDGGVACILYSQTAEANVALDSTSPWTFFDRGGICPSSTATSSSAAATATCTGFEGYDAGSNIGYYTAYGTYSACYSICEANSACLSFAIVSSPAACIIYDYTVEGNDISYPGSGNFFYDRGGVCISSSSTSSVAASSTSSVSASSSVSGSSTSSTSGFTTSVLSTSSSAGSSKTSSSATSSATTPAQSGAFPGVSSNLFFRLPPDTVKSQARFCLDLTTNNHFSVPLISFPTTSTPTPRLTCPAIPPIPPPHACRTTMASTRTATCACPARHRFAPRTRTVATAMLASRTQTALSMGTTLAWPCACTCAPAVLLLDAMILRATHENLGEVKDNTKRPKYDFFFCPFREGLGNFIMIITFSSLI